MARKIDLSKAKQVQVERKGQRDGDNGDSYQQTVYVIEPDKKKTITTHGVSLTGGAGALWVILRLLGADPSTAPVQPDSTKVDITATKARSYQNKNALEAHISDFKQHVALQDQWQKNQSERDKQQFDYIKEQLNDLKQELRKK